MGLWGRRLNDDSPQYLTAKVLASTLFWALTYKLQALFTKDSQKSAEWRCRVVSFIHGSVVAAAASYSQLVEGPNMFSTAPGESNNDTQMTIIVACFGYFLYDMTWCLYYQTEPAIMLVHHALSLFGIVYSTYACKWGTELVAILATMEVTNPMLQTRWFLRECGYKDRPITALVDWIFILMFVAFRILLGAVQLYAYYTHPKPDFLGRLGGVSMYALNVVFLYYIVGYARRKYFPTHQAAATTNGHAKTVNGTLAHQTNGVAKHLKSS